MSPDQMLLEQLRLLTEQNAWLKWYVIVTAVIAFATVTQEWWRAMLTRVNLVVQVDEITPSPMGIPQAALAHYVRLRVKNETWWKTARNVEVVLEKVSRKGPASGAYAQGGNVFGINLEWSHFPRQGLMPQMAAGTSRTVDLGHVVRPSDRPTVAANNDPGVEDKPGADPNKTIFKLGTVVSPLTRNHLLEPGEWEIVLRVGGENVRSRKVTVQVKLPGTWSNDPVRFGQEDFSYSVS